MSDELNSTTIDTNPDDQQFQQPKKHSGLGIASFILAIVAIVSFIIIMIMSVAAVTDLVGDFADPAAIEEMDVAQFEDAIPAFAVIGLLSLVVLFCNLIGCVLGIIGLVQKNRKRIFAVLGTVLNGLALVGYAGLLLLSLLMGV